MSQYKKVQVLWKFSSQYCLCKFCLSKFLLCSVYIQVEAYHWARAQLGHCLREMSMSHGLRQRWAGLSSSVGGLDAWSEKPKNIPWRNLKCKESDIDPFIACLISFLFWLHSFLTITTEGHSRLSRETNQCIFSSLFLLCRGNPTILRKLDVEHQVTSISLSIVIWCKLL